MPAIFDPANMTGISQTDAHPLNVWSTKGVHEGAASAAKRCRNGSAAGAVDFQLFGLKAIDLCWFRAASSCGHNITVAFI
jgi:hypothetical protein